MYTKDDVNKLVEEIAQDNERQRYQEDGPYPARVTSCNDAERHASSLRRHKANRALSDALRDMRREQEQSFAGVSHDLSIKM